jgi:hypothetical protein
MVELIAFLAQGFSIFISGYLNRPLLFLSLFSIYDIGAYGLKIQGRE